MTSNLLAVPRPLGGFPVIVADPPWRYKTFSGHGVPQRHTIEPHYPTMSEDELCALPVRMMAARDCALHMWTISSHVDQAIRVAEAWGFGFKTLGFVWVKVTKGGKPDVLSLGKWMRQQSEISLLFSRGKPSRRAGAGGVRQLIHAPRREHSRKPDGFYERVEALSRGPYLDLFGRREAEGWTVFNIDPARFPETETPASGAGVLQSLRGVAGS